MRGFPVLSCFFHSLSSNHQIHKPVEYFETTSPAEEHLSGLFQTLADVFPILRRFLSRRQIFCSNNLHSPPWFYAAECQYPLANSHHKSIRSEEHKSVLQSRGHL